jgi:hypothetical protein
LKEAGVLTIEYCITLSGVSPEEWRRLTIMIICPTSLLPSSATISSVARMDAAGERRNPRRFCRELAARVPQDIASNDAEVDFRDHARLRERRRDDTTNYCHW